MQREFLVDHVDGMRPFTTTAIDNMTRESMLARRLIRFEPDVRTRLGVPDGTVLTKDGREALCCILGQYADALMRAVAVRKIDQNSEAVLFRILAETALHWSSQDELAKRTATLD